MHIWIPAQSERLIQWIKCLKNPILHCDSLEAPKPIPVAAAVDTASLRLQALSQLYIKMESARVEEAGGTRPPGLIGLFGGDRGGEARSPSTSQSCIVTAEIMSRCKT